jgi:hypothetical protein
VGAADQVIEHRHRVCLCQCVDQMTADEPCPACDENVVTNEVVLARESSDCLIAARFAPSPHCYGVATRTPADAVFGGPDATT